MILLPLTFNLIYEPSSGVVNSIIMQIKLEKYKIFP